MNTVDLRETLTGYYTSFLINILMLVLEKTAKYKGKNNTMYVSNILLMTIFCILSSSNNDIINGTEYKFYICLYYIYLIK